MAKPKWATGNPIKMLKPKIEDTIEVPGYICETLKLSHLCIENWLFSSTTQKKITIVKSKVEDCLLEFQFQF